MQTRKVALSLLLLGAAAGAAQAEDLTGTLKKINDSGVIVVSHQFPFLTTTTSKKWLAIHKTTQTPSLRRSKPS